MGSLGTINLHGNMTTNPPNLERGGNLFAMSVVPLGFIISGYLLFFLLPWRESAAVRTQTERGRND